jgi:pimeloyl-ACP methyl ester carboxylesterase
METRCSDRAKVTTMQTFKNTETRSIEVDGTRFVFRELGPKGSVPVIFLHHLTAVLDDWDPRVVDGIAAKHHVVTFDNRGVGGSGGVTPISVPEMARDAIAFVSALGFEKVDLFGFSLGGFVAQAVIHARPDLVRKAVLSGTGPAGGEGIAGVGAILQDATSRTAGTGRHPKHILFFTQTRDGQNAADEFIRRLNERAEGRDTRVSNETIGAQLTAIDAWGNGTPTPLETVAQPVLVANGDDDIMVPTRLSFDLARRMPNSHLSIFPNSGHGGVFEHHAVFVPQVLAFLSA